MQQVVWFINKSHENCWDWNLVGKDKKRQRFSSEGLLFSWYIFMKMPQYFLKFLHWKRFKTFWTRCLLSIWTYWNKFVYFFFQIMILFAMNIVYVTFESLFWKVLRHNLSFVSVSQQIIRQTTYEKGLSHTNFHFVGLKAYYECCIGLALLYITHCKVMWHFLYYIILHFSF